MQPQQKVTVDRSTAAGWPQKGTAQDLLSLHHTKIELHAKKKKKKKTVSNFPLFIPLHILQVQLTKTSAMQNSRLILDINVLPIYS